MVRRTDNSKDRGSSTAGHSQRRSSSQRQSSNSRPRNEAARSRTSSSRPSSRTSPRVDKPRKERDGSRGQSLQRASSTRRASDAHSLSRDSQRGRKSLAGSRQIKSGPSLFDRYKTIFSTPLSRGISGFIIVFILAALLFGAFDTVMSVGRIHPKVSIAGVDIGGMNKEDATAFLNEELNKRLVQGHVTIYASQEAEDVYASKVEFDDATADNVATYDQGSVISSVTNEEKPMESSWTAVSTSMGASVDGASIATKAYEVGRGDNRVIERLKAWLFGVVLEPEVAINDASLHNAMTVINDTIGTPYTDAEVLIDGSNVTTTADASGFLVSEADLKRDLSAAFLTENRGFIVDIKTTAPQVTQEMANAAAEQIKSAIANEATLHFMGSVWTLTSSDLAKCVATRVEGEGQEKKLVPYVDTASTVALYSSHLGSKAGNTAKDAWFDVSSGVPVIVPSVTGIGPMLEKGANGMQEVLFGGGYRSEKRAIVLLPGNVEPDITTADAQSMGIVEMVSTYTTYMNQDGTVEKNFNINHLCNDIMPYTYIPPHSVYSFNETSGNCTVERGFMVSFGYMGGVVTRQEGGGICAVATTVFNAALPVGYPILERQNHSLFSPPYETMLDATVSYPSPDFKFENDTDNWLLLTLSADDESATATLWGTKPGYTVEIVWGAWQLGNDMPESVNTDDSEPVGWSEITTVGSPTRRLQVTRNVSKDGVPLHSDVFKSYFLPSEQVTTVGTGLGTG